jgi:hypothetical protein
VVLTIDAGLQEIAEDALSRAIESSGASGGDVLIVDPRTGDLLAVASRRHDGSLKVPAFTDPFEPGSTAKPFLLASLLSEGLVSLTDSIDVMHGVFKDGRRVIRDVHPYDKLTVAEVVRYSSNVGAALLSKRLSYDMQHKYLRDFGFGLPTGIDYPAESSGLLRRPDRWSGLSQASLAMGYEISVTSLQLVMAYAALANGGRLLRPRLLKEVRSHTGEVLERWDPQTIRRVIDERVASQITEVLTSVVEGGTGTRAAMTTLSVAAAPPLSRTVPQKTPVSSSSPSWRTRKAPFTAAPSPRRSVAVLSRRRSRRAASRSLEGRPYRPPSTSTGDSRSVRPFRRMSRVLSSLSRSPSHRIPFGSHPPTRRRTCPRTPRWIRRWTPFGSRRSRGARDGFRTFAA